MKPSMLFAAALTAGGLLAVPASAAELLHQTSIVHNGRTLAVSYEPQVETDLRQTGIGPRSQPSCLWEARVSVRRSAATAEGQPVSALARVIEGGPARKGARLGHCSSLRGDAADKLAGDDAALRSLLSDVATRDAPTLRSDLASLDALTAPVSHAR